MSEEGLKKTDNDLIHIGCPVEFDTDVFLENLEGLMQAAYSNKENIRTYVEKMVPTYHPENAGDGAKKDSVYEELVTEGK